MVGSTVTSGAWGVGVFLADLETLGCQNCRQQSTGDLPVNRLGSICLAFQQRKLDISPLTVSFFSSVTFCIYKNVSATNLMGFSSQNGRLISSHCHKRSPCFTHRFPAVQEERWDQNWRFQQSSPDLSSISTSPVKL